MTRALRAIGLWLSLTLFVASASAANLHALIVVGLPGTDAYAEQFAAQAAQIKGSAEALTGAARVKILQDALASRERVLAQLQAYGALAEDDRVAVFLIGHGSYDGFEYKFNLPGPDLTDADLRAGFDQIGAGTALLVNTSSASGALLEALKQDNRILITATRSGGERQATRFGQYFAAALANPAADLNKNDVISAREAFDYAQRQVADWFEFEGRIATEHATLAGDRAAQFSVARLTAQPASGTGPALTALFARRDDLDERIQNLQLNRDSLASSDYFQRLEALLLELAGVQEEIDALERDDNGR
jgi:hypothetical protein